MSVPRPTPDQNVTVEISKPPEFHRGWAIAGCFALYGRILGALPMLIVLYIFGIGAFFIAWVMQFTIVTRGEASDSSYDFLTRYVRWSTRMQAFIYGLSDRYPTMDSMQP